MRAKRWVCLLLAGILSVSALPLTASARLATFKEYKLVQMRNFPYDFCKGGMGGENEEYFNVGRYAKDDDGNTIIKWGLMEKATLKLIYPCQSHASTTSADSEGVITVLSTQGEGLVLRPNVHGRETLLGTLKGKTLASYDGVNTESDLIAVCRDGKWGAVDYQGREVLGLQFDSAPLFHEGIAQVYDASLDEYVFINTKGERLFAENAQLAGVELSAGFRDGRCVVQKYDESRGTLSAVIDANGQMVLDFGDYDIERRLEDGNLLVCEDYFSGHPEANLKTYGVITPDGQPVVPMTYQEIQMLDAGWNNDFTPGLYIVKKLKNPPSAPEETVPWDAPANWYVYESGKGEISPASDTRYFSHVVDGECRYTQETAEGTFVLNADFERIAGPFLWVNWSGSLGGTLSIHDDDRYFITTLDNQAGIFDKNFTVILAPEYDSLYYSVGGVMVAVKDGKYGVIRETGEVMVEFIYDHMSAIYLQPFGLRVFCAHRYHDDGLSSWEANDGRTDRCWLIAEDGERLSDEMNGGLYGWGSGYVAADYVISTMPYKAPAASARRMPAAMKAVPMLRTETSVQIEDEPDPGYEPRMLHYTAERIADYVLEDGATGVRVTATPDCLLDGTALSAQKVTAGADYEAVQAALEGKTDKFTLFDLALMYRGDAVQPGGAVQVSLPLEAGAAGAFVYTVDGAGRLTRLNASKKGGCLAFATAALGKFVLVPMETALGDITRDDAITVSDARRALQYIVGKITLDDDQLMIGDVNADGRISTADARLILRRAVGKIDSFPAA